MPSNQLVPMVVGRTALGERSFDIYSRLLAERVVMLGTPVTEEAANLIIAQLIHLEAEDPDKEISLYINSPGGSAYAALAIYDTMQFVTPAVSTIAVGMAMSAGALVLAGGAPGKRFALPNSKIMIHQGSAGFEGTPADIEIHAREVLSIKQRVAEIFACHTGKSVPNIEDAIDRDRFMTATEACEFGIIDEVLHGRKDIKMSPFKPYPRLSAGENGRKS